MQVPVEAASGSPQAAAVCANGSQATHPQINATFNFNFNDQEHQSSLSNTAIRQPSVTRNSADSSKSNTTATPVCRHCGDPVRSRCSSATSCMVWTGRPTSYPTALYSPTVVAQNRTGGTRSLTLSAFHSFGPHDQRHRHPFRRPLPCAPYVPRTTTFKLRSPSLLAKQSPRGPSCSPWLPGRKLPITPYQ